MAFPSVVAGGKHSCTIHYSRIDRAVADGDLLLVDAGCEYFGYVSDVTRVWAPSGKFSEPQRVIYNLVLTAQQECIEMCRPGVTLRQIHNHSVDVLLGGLRRLRVVPDGSHTGRDWAGPLGRLVSFHEEKFMHQVYPTVVGHWLGMDTHDCKSVSLNTPLEAGVVLTIEPGLYLPARVVGPSKFAGIGVRIEDDVLITETGHEVLTASVPKEIDHLEAFVRQANARSRW